MRYILDERFGGTVIFENIVISSEGMHLKIHHPLPDNFPKHTPFGYLIFADEISKVHSIKYGGTWVFHSGDNRNIGHYLNEHIYPVLRTIFFSKLFGISSIEGVISGSIPYSPWNKGLFDAAFNGSIVSNLSGIKDRILVEKLIIPFSDQLLYFEDFLSVFNLLWRSEPFKPWPIKEKSVLIYDVIPEDGKILGRNIANIDQVINFFNKHQYSVEIINNISTRSIPFSDQIRMYSENSIVISSWGANITNSLLTSSKNKIVLLYQDGLNMPWWDKMVNIMNSLGRNFFILRMPVLGNESPMKSEINVDLKLLESLI